MGRGRAKAKQTKVARRLKYTTTGTDLDRLKEELAGLVLLLHRGQQAFRVGRCAWGLQFHPEVRKEQVMTWWADGRELPQPLPTLSDELDAKLPAWHELGRKVCLAFLAATSD